MCKCSVNVQIGACCNLSICSNVQITKYLDLSNRSKNSSKSRKLWFFLPKFGRKVAMSGQSVFCPNFITTPLSANLPIFQINHIHFHTLGDRSRQSISWCHISLDVSVRESESRNANHAMSLVQFSPKYTSTCWKWEVGTNPEQFGCKTFYGTKLRKALPNRLQIRS